MQSPRPEKPHHHGNLREALIVAGTELLAEGGLQALTLRKCAARVGVSHAAPAHHFDGLKGLLTAIASRGFERFVQAMEQASASAAPDARAQLLGICHGYLKFSSENQALAALMFMTDRLDMTLDTLQRHSFESYQVLVRGCAPFCTQPEARKTLENLIWSLVQGYADLSRNGQVKGENDEFGQMFALLDLQPIDPG